MARPKAEFVRWMGPLLECLREFGGSAKPREVSDCIASKLTIPDEQRRATLKSGAERFHNQVAWARQYLVWEGLLDASRRGEWALTAAGANARLTEEDGRKLFKKWVQIHAARRASKETGEGAADTKDVESDAPAAEAAVVDAIREVEAKVAPDEVDQNELLSVIQGLPPKGFERLCKRLLHEWGFENVEVTGGSHDGGVDGVGILQLNPFVTFQIAFQCKRYRGSVSRDQVASFRGSAKAGRADKLILITTGSFTKEAIKEAHGSGANPVELVAGDKLVSLFHEKQLGVRPKEGFDVDHSFFDQFRSIS